jgi:bifunctional oligoribonuclease and PAP phosphatase NrnA
MHEAALRRHYTEEARRFARGNCTMAIDWRPLVDWIGRKQRLLVTTHVRPDGDGLGSMKALAGALKALGKQVHLVSPSHMPDRYVFLDPEQEIRAFQPPGDEWRNVDGVMVLDTGTWNQLAGMADFIRGLAVEKVVIDHHVTQDDLGARRYVDTSAEATGRLVFEFIQALGTPLAPAATPLFVALAMDTGWFRHSNTTPRTLTMAAELVAAGAQPDYLHQQLYDRNSLGRMKLTGLVLSRLTLVTPPVGPASVPAGGDAGPTGGLIAHSTILKTDYAATGSKPPDTEDLVNYTLSVVGVEIGILFMEQPRGGVKVSFRSRSGVSVAAIAQQFGGGGHPAAAGAIIEAPLETVQERVLKAVMGAME